MQAGFTIKDLELAFKVTKHYLKTLRIGMGEKKLLIKFRGFFQGSNIPVRPYLYLYAADPFRTIS